ncbi:tetratricopeptide repeat protein [Rheinheimera mangrovi]|uniref:tetratricopeptide repeat protein n=1 Tax=Rheinheimera mangrovi TaxID=2498451 RepID=UPI000F8F2503|nr:tetratricopeptide repeat protein [Rheinheimera mangrovi]
MKQLDSAQLMQQALGLYQSQQYQQSIRLLQLLASRHKEHAQVWHLKALTERKLGQELDALASFEHAFKLQPDNPELLNNFANLLKRHKQEARAISLFHRAIELQPQYFDAYYNAALLLQKQLRLREAIPLLQKALSFKPKHPDAILALAQAFEKSGRVNDAEVLLEATVAEQPGQLKLWLMYSSILRHQGKYQYALEQLAQAMARNPADLSLKREYATILYLTGDTKAAIMQVKYLLQQFPTDASLHHLLSDFSWLTGDDDCFSHYEQLLVQQPQLLHLYGPYIQKLIKANALVKAEQITDLYLAQKQTAEALVYKGFLRRSAGDAGHALSFLSAAFQQQPTDSEIRNEMALCYLSLEENEHALLQFKALIKDFPLNQAWYAHYAAALKHLGQSTAYRHLYNYDSFVQVRAVEPPAGYASIQQFNQSLASVITPLHQTQRHPLDQSLRHGTQTDDHLFLRQEEPIQQLEQQIRQQVLLYIQSLPQDNSHPFLCRKSDRFLFTGAWSVRLNQSGFHKNHYHSEGWISGCYYVDIPPAVEEKGQGWIKFGQAELTEQLAMQPDILVKPQAGTVVLFPSMMWHGTEPFAGQHYRLTVAFDLIPLD